jgi:hypothetical protein
MRSLTGSLILAGATLAEAQQTICTRIGNMVQCDTPTYPSGQPSGGAGGALQGFTDTYLRMRESQPPVIIIQPPAKTEQQLLDEKECPPGYYLKSMWEGCFQGTR